MASVTREGEWYVVAVGGDELGKFGALLDANCFALQLLERGAVGSVTLPSGLIIV